MLVKVGFGDAAAAACLPMVTKIKSLEDNFFWAQILKQGLGPWAPLVWSSKSNVWRSCPYLETKKATAFSKTENGR